MADETSWLDMVFVIALLYVVGWSMAMVIAVVLASTVLGDYAIAAGSAVVAAVLVVMFVKLYRVSGDMVPSPSDDGTDSA